MSMLATAIAKSLFSFVLMAVIAAICAGVIRLIVILLARRKPALPEPMVVSVVPSRDEKAEISAVIAAAVHHALSTRHRIVFIGEAPPGSSGWTRQLRARHHASHTLRR